MIAHDAVFKIHLCVHSLILQIGEVRGQGPVAREHGWA